MTNGSGNRSIHIGGNASNSAIIAGDRNQVTQEFKRVSPPPPESVDINAELATLRALLTKLSTPDAQKIKNAVSEAEDEVARPQPDKKEVGTVLERAITYAKKTEDFAETAESLIPHIIKIAGWLGAAGTTLLTLFDLTI